MNFGNNPKINTLYAQLAFNRNVLYWICNGQPDNGDVMATQAVEFAIGMSPKPAFMVQAGL